MSGNVAYHRTAERPSLQVWWFDDAGTLIDFSSGYTFSLKLGSQGSAAILTKTSGITGAAGSGTEPTGTPNITIVPASGELDIAPGTYLAQLTATTGGLDRVKTFSFTIIDTVT